MSIAVSPRRTGSSPHARHSSGPSNPRRATPGSHTSSPLVKPKRSTTPRDTDVETSSSSSAHILRGPFTERSTETPATSVSENDRVPNAAPVTAPVAAPVAILPQPTPPPVRAILAQSTLPLRMEDFIQFEKSGEPGGASLMPYKQVNGVGPAAASNGSLGALASLKGKGRASEAELAAEEGGASASQSSGGHIDLFTFPIGSTFPGGGSRLAAGLYNQGNTCYLNSVMQALAHTAPLVHTLRSRKLDELLGPMGRERQFCVVEKMVDFVKDVFTRRVTSPKDFTVNLKRFAKGLRPGRQEDSHEYLRLLLDAMQQECLLGAPKDLPPNDPLRETTFVHKIFGGRLRSRVACQSCRNNSDTFEAFLDLSLDVVNQNSVLSALRAFTKEDKLMGRDKYNCGHCKQRVIATKRFTIDKLPPVLTIHLKRFTITGGKINKLIRFDDTLTIPGDVTSDKVARSYCLYAVVHHFGSGPNSGHYVATVRSPAGNWMRMDDDYVQHAGSPASDKHAYMLFYIQDKQSVLQEALMGRSSSALSDKTHNVMVRKRPRVRDDDEEEEQGSARSVLGPASQIGRPPPLRRNDQPAYPMSSPTAYMNGSARAVSPTKTQSRSSPASNATSFYAKPKKAANAPPYNILGGRDDEDLGMSVEEETTNSGYEDLVTLAHSPHESDDEDAYMAGPSSSSAGPVRLSRAAHRKERKRQREEAGRKPPMLNKGRNGGGGGGGFGYPGSSPYVQAGGYGGGMARQGKFEVGLEDAGSGRGRPEWGGGKKQKNQHLVDYGVPPAFGKSRGGGGGKGGRGRGRGHVGQHGMAGRMQGKNR